MTIIKDSIVFLGERSKIEKLVQMAWTFINDSLCTSLCLQWEPQIVAVAVMYLAGELPLTYNLTNFSLLFTKAFKFLS